ncbi:MAG: ATP-binding protein [Thermodesulfobacteriota bacterium]|nr:ATP-binding protein [Thermodesulfobacteriota bacterium]
MKLSRVLFLLSFLAVLSLITGGYLSYVFLKRSTLQAVHQEAVVQAEHIQSRLSAFLDKHYKITATLAGLADIRYALLNKNPQALQRVNALLDHFQSTLGVDVCYLMDHTGETIAASNRYAPDSFEGKNYAFRPYFQEAMKGRHRVSYMALGVTSGRRGVYFSHPVYWQNDPAPIGVVVIKAGVWSLEERVMKHYDGIAMLISPQGIVFMTNRPSLALKSLKPLTENESRQLRQTRQFGNGPWEKAGLAFEMEHAIDAQGTQYVVQESAIDLYPGWRLLYLSDCDAFFRQLSIPIIKISAYIIPIVCICVIIIIVLLYRKARDDISQRQLYENALLKSRETQKVLLNATTDSAVLLDDNGKILAINEPAADRIGRDADACIGLNVFDVGISAHTKDRIREALDKGVKTARPAIVTYRDDGHWFEMNAYPVAGSHGHPVQVAMFRRDITAQKEAEEMLVRAKETAEAANRAKSEFLSNMSHELRSPMTVILGYSQMMQEDGSFPAEHLENLNAINQSGRHLLSLINEALHFTRIEAKKESLNVTTFDLHALIRELESMFRIKTDKKNLTFELAGLANVPRYIATDAQKLRQILINLLTNALQFTGQGTVAIHLSAQPGKADTILIRIQVSDTGVGIAASELDNVFDHFQQTTSGRERGGGSGLGLAISRAYARLMGGDIVVESEPGRGSTFTLEITATHGPPPAAVSPENPRVTGLVPGQVIPRILVVEDIPESRNLLVRILGKAGLDVKDAENGQVAVDLARQWRPAFIWMDIRMPVMDGLTATRMIKETMPEVVIVALTAHAFEEEKEIVLAAGCDDFVRKPYQTRDIFDVMARHLGLEYQYGDNTAAGDAAGPSNPVRAGLSKDTEGQLRQALAREDRMEILTLISQIKKRNQMVGQKLEGLAQTFDYKAILRYLDENRNKPAADE